MTANEKVAELIAGGARVVVAEDGEVAAFGRGATPEVVAWLNERRDEIDLKASAESGSLDRRVREFEEREGIKVGSQPNFLRDLLRADFEQDSSEPKLRVWLDSERDLFTANLGGRPRRVVTKQILPTTESRRRMGVLFGGE